MIKISDTEYFSNDKTIRFLNMDCNVFMAGCKENEFDLNLSDPPYGLKTATVSKPSEKNGNSQQKFYNDFMTKKWDDYIPDKEHFDIVKKTAKHYIIFGGNYMAEHLGNTKCILIWDKMTYIPTMSQFEFAFCSFNKHPKMIKINSNDSDRMHPTQKPIELYKWILDNYTKPTDTILDCFGGSMSNAIACHMKRRKLTIIELDVDYFKSALNRFEIYERQVEDIKEFGYAKTKVGAQNPVLF